MSAEMLLGEKTQERTGPRLEQKALSYLAHPAQSHISWCSLLLDRFERSSE